MKKKISAAELMKAAEIWGLELTLAAAGGQCRISVPVPKSMMDMSIDELTLSVRARNGLMRAGRDTIGKTVELIMSEKGINSLRNIGRKTTVEINRSIVFSAYERMDSQKRLKFWANFIEVNDLSR